MSSPTTNQITNSSQVNGVTLTDVLNALRVTVGDGSGDMLRSVYDTDNDGKVDVANVAESVPWTGITEKPTLFPAQPYTHEHPISEVTGLQAALDSKQPTLTSGSNIKSINGDSILGVGNLTLSTDTALRTDLISSSSGKGAELVAFKHNSTDAVSRTVHLKLSQDFWTVKDFGASVGTGGDDTLAFQKALTNEESVEIPPGNYIVSDKLTVGLLSKQKLWGHGRGVTKITSMSTTEPLIYFAGSVAGLALSGVTLDRGVTPTSTAHGIDFNRIGEGWIDDVYVLNHYYGILLGEAGFSNLRNSQISKNYNDGVRMQTGSTGQLQWTLRNLLIDQNAGNGLAVFAVGSAASTSLGEWDMISTFANSGWGIRVEGESGKAIHGVRLRSSFIGQDGNSELRLNTFGGHHKITDNFFELSGTGTTGRTLATAASNIGMGIDITANNEDVSVVTNRISGCSYTGIRSQSTRSTIIGNEVINCGVALLAGERTGIRVSGNATVVSNTAINSGGSTTQQYGFYNDTDTVHMVANKASGNTVADFDGAAVVNSIKIANSGSTANYLTGALQVSGNLTTKSGLIGYSAGEGGTVTQLTDKSTSVTLNKSSGVITMANSAMTNGAVVTFTLNSTRIAANSTVSASAAGFAGPYRVSVGNVQAGSCQITIQNSSGVSLSDALNINFAVLNVSST